MIQVKDLDLYEAKDEQGKTHVGRRLIANGKVFIQKWQGMKQIAVQVKPETVKEVKL